MTYVFECHPDDYFHITQYFRDKKDLKVTNERDVGDGVKEFTIEYDEINKEEFSKSHVLYDNFIKTITDYISGIDEASRRGFKAKYPTTSVLCHLSDDYKNCY